MDEVSVPSEFEKGLISEFVRVGLEPLIGIVSSTLMEGRSAIRARLTSTYSKYLARVLGRYSRAKSFFIRDEPVPLYDFFVPLDIMIGNRTIEKPKAADIAPHAIVLGTGGSGKSLLMRHFLISALSDAHKVPVLVELRDLNRDANDLKGTAIHDHVAATLSNDGLEMSNSVYEKALKVGAFCILLDGYDELTIGLRDAIGKQIRQLSEKFPATWIFLSSRDDHGLYGWSDSRTFKVAPLTLPYAIDLIRKLPYDIEMKDKFSAALASHLFEEHRSFLSNPLLLSIMLLTYRENADIPIQLGIFYAQAYAALFQQHDALKGGFRRERGANLNIVDFEKAFASFCVQTYDKRAFSFGPVEAVRYLDRGKALSGVSYQSDALLEDAVQAVCLLVEEGLMFAFAHRSFQEYFVARFVQDCSESRKAAFIKRFSPNIRSDAVLRILHELDQRAVEEYYVLPFIDQLGQWLGTRERVSPDQFAAYVRRGYSEWAFIRGKLIFKTKDDVLLDGVEFIRERYLVTPHMKEAEIKPLGELLLKEAWSPQRSPVSGSLATDTLTSESPFLIEMAHGHAYPSIRMLESILELGRFIRARHRDSNASLKELFG